MENNQHRVIFVDLILRQASPRDGHVAGGSSNSYPLETSAEREIFTSSSRSPGSFVSLTFLGS